MMDCKEFRELLDLFVDGELPPEATASARTHLYLCPACRRVERQMLRLRQTMKHVVAAHKLPPELINNIRRLARPAWRRLIPRFRSDQETTFEDARNMKPLFWKRKLVIPMPTLLLLLVLALALGVWAASMRRSEPLQTSVISARQAAPPPSQPTALGGFSLAQFDRGERAAIYKIRLADQKIGEQEEEKR